MMTTKGILASLKESIPFPIYVHRLRNKEVLVESANIDQVEAIMRKYPQFGRERTDRGLVLSLNGDGSGCPRCHYGEFDIIIKMRMPGYLDPLATRVTVGLLTFDRETIIKCKVCKHVLDMPLDRYPGLEV